MPSRMAARAGIEPTYSVPKAEVLTFGRPSSIYGWLQDVAFNRLVPEAGFEPACLSATDFESVTSTSSVTRAYRRYRVNRRLIDYTWYSIRWQLRSFRFERIDLSAYLDTRTHCMEYRIGIYVTDSDTEWNRWCPRRDSNAQAHMGRGILSAVRMPVPTRGRNIYGIRIYGTNPSNSWCCI